MHMTDEERIRIHRLLFSQDCRLGTIRGPICTYPWPPQPLNQAIMQTKKNADPVYHSDGGKQCISTAYNEKRAEHGNAAFTEGHPVPLMPLLGPMVC